MIYPSAEISYWNRLMTSTCEFKKYIWEVFDELKENTNSKKSRGTLVRLLWIDWVVEHWLYYYVRKQCFQVKCRPWFWELLKSNVNFIYIYIYIYIYSWFILHVMAVLFSINALSVIYIYFDVFMLEYWLVLHIFFESTTCVNIW
jgi:hypothetical protein